MYVVFKEEWIKVESDSYFYFIDGFFVKNGFVVLLGWFFWGLNVVLSWVMMLGVSFVLRLMMNKRVEGMVGGLRVGVGVFVVVVLRGVVFGDVWL